MLDSPFFERLDQAHGGALSMLSSRDEVQSTSARESDAVQGDDAGAGSSVGAASSDTDASDCEAIDPDPTDEVMTGGGDSLTLLCALFIDGVQLHDHGRATTTVVGLKFLDLPGFLCNTDVACFPLAYIGGSKEPTCLTEITALILEQFKDHEVSAVKGIDGDASHRLVICSICSMACHDLCVDEDTFASGKTQIRGNPIMVWDSFRKRWRKVFPVLVFAYADTPARRGWAMTTGHTGKSGCDKCGIRGVRKLPGGIVLTWTAFAGYFGKCPALLFGAKSKVCTRHT